MGPSRARPPVSAWDEFVVFAGLAVILAFCGLGLILALEFAGPDPVAERTPEATVTPHCGNPGVLPHCQGGR